jgi:hypothetical protein
LGTVEYSLNPFSAPLKGNSIELKAEPLTLSTNGHSRLTAWVFTDAPDTIISAEETYNISMDSDLDITGVFERYYNIDLITDDSEKGTVDGANEYIDGGEEVSVTAIPEDGFKFSSWTCSPPQPALELNSGTVTINGLTDDITLTAIFASSEDYTLTSSVSPADIGGLSSVSHESVTEGSGEEVEFSLDVSGIDSEKWSFDGWFKGSETTPLGTEEIITLTEGTDFSENTVLTAKFSRIYNVSLSSEYDSDKGTLTLLKGSTSYPDGLVLLKSSETDKIKIVIDTADNYKLKDWENIPSGMTTHIDGTPLSTLEYGYSDMQGDFINIKPVFNRINTVTVGELFPSGYDWGNSVTVKSGDESAGAGESVEALDNEEVTLTATPGTDCEFVKWTVNGTDYTSTPYIFTAADQDYSVTAEFTKTHTVTVESAEGGTTDKTGPVSIAHEEDFTVAASDSGSYKFSEWIVKGEDGGEVEDDFKERSLSLESVAESMTVTPVFEDVYDVTFDYDEAKVISLNDNQKGLHQIVPGETIEFAIETKDHADSENYEYALVKWNLQNAAGSIESDTETDTQITFTPSGNGMISPVIGTKVDIKTSIVSGSGEEVHGTIVLNTHHDKNVAFIGKDVTVIATPQKDLPEGGHSMMKHWIVNGEYIVAAEDVASDSFAYIFEVKDHTEIQAVIGKYYNVNITADENGSVSGSKFQIADGESISITAVPQQGYKFQKWQVIEGDAGGINLSQSKLDINYEQLTGDIRFNASFEEVKDIYNLTVGVRPQNSNSIASVSHAHVEEGCGMEVSYNAESSDLEEWEFTAWESDNGEVISTNKNFTLTEGDDFNENTHLTAVFERLYNITLIAGISSDGQIEIRKNGTLLPGMSEVLIGTDDHVTLKALPEEEYHFVKWYGIPENVQQSNNVVTIKYSDIENDIYGIKADFARKTTIDIVTPEAGSVNVTDENGNVITETTELFEESTLTLEYVSEEGYRFLYWLIDDTEEIEQNPYTYTIKVNDAAVKKIEAVIVQIHDITLEAPEEGGITTKQAMVHKVDHGTLFEVEALANIADSYQFDFWNITDGEGITDQETDSSLKLNVDQDYTVHPLFSQFYKVKAETEGKYFGNISIKDNEDTQIDVKSGTELTFVATPFETEENNKFIGWKINDIDLEDNTDTELVLNIDYHKNITGVFNVFQKVTVNRNADSAGGSVVNSDGSEMIETVFEVPINSTFKGIKAVPHNTDSYTFGYWTVTFELQAGSEEIQGAELEINDVVDNIIVAAKFLQKIPVNIIFNPESSGVITASPETAIEGNGLGVYVSSTDSGKFKFKNWSGIEGIANKAEIDIAEPFIEAVVSRGDNLSALQANYEEAFSITASAENPELGKIAAGISQLVFHGDTSSEIIAEAMDDKYTFIEWRGLPAKYEGLRHNSNLVLNDVTQDISVEAVFENIGQHKVALKNFNILRTIDKELLKEHSTIDLENGAKAVIINDTGLEDYSATYDHVNNVITPKGGLKVYYSLQGNPQKLLPFGEATFDFNKTFYSYKFLDLLKHLRGITIETQLEHSYATNAVNFMSSQPAGSNSFQHFYDFLLKFNKATYDKLDKVYIVYEGDYSTVYPFGGFVIANNNIEVDNDKSIKDLTDYIPNCSDDYAFKNWMDENNNILNDSDKIGKDMMLYSVFTEKPAVAIVSDLPLDNRRIMMVNSQIFRYRTSKYRKKLNDFAKSGGINGYMMKFNKRDKNEASSTAKHVNTYEELEKHSFAIYFSPNESDGNSYLYLKDSLYRPTNYYYFMISKNKVDNNIYTSYIESADKEGNVTISKDEFPYQFKMLSVFDISSDNAAAEVEIIHDKQTKDNITIDNVNNEKVMMSHAISVDMHMPNFKSNNLLKSDKKRKIIYF